jgi:hypothetical protein
MDGGAGRDTADTRRAGQGRAGSGKARRVLARRGTTRLAGHGRVRAALHGPAGLGQAGLALGARG